MDFRGQGQRPSQGQMAKMTYFNTKVSFIDYSKFYIQLAA